ncbi:hypothetical protein CHUAL_003401 [Chamberlinius hualienensis]
MNWETGSIDEDLLEMECVMEVELMTAEYERKKRRQQNSVLQQNQQPLLPPMPAQRSSNLQFPNVNENGIVYNSMDYRGRDTTSLQITEEVRKYLGDGHQDEVIMREYRKWQQTQQDEEAEFKKLKQKQLAEEVERKKRQKKDVKQEFAKRLPRYQNVPAETADVLEGVAKMERVKSWIEGVSTIEHNRDHDSINSFQQSDKKKDVCQILDQAKKQLAKIEPYGEYSDDLNQSSRKGIEYSQCKWNPFQKLTDFELIDKDFPTLATSIKDSSSRSCAVVNQQTPNKKSSLKTPKSKRINAYGVKSKSNTDSSKSLTRAHYVPTHLYKPFDEDVDEVRIQFSNASIRSNSSDTSLIGREFYTPKTYDQELCAFETRDPTIEATETRERELDVLANYDQELCASETSHQELCASETSKKKLCALKINNQEFCSQEINDKELCAPETSELCTSVAHLPLTSYASPFTWEPNPSTFYKPQRAAAHSTWGQSSASYTVPPISNVSSYFFQPGVSGQVLVSPPAVIPFAPNSFPASSMTTFTPTPMTPQSLLMDETQMSKILVVENLSKTQTRADIETYFRDFERVSGMGNINEIFIENLEDSLKVFIR